MGGKVRDIVTERIRTKAEREADEKEDRIRNLPEFKRGGAALGDKIEASASAADWDCPKCGDGQKGRFETCKRCGTPRPEEGELNAKKYNVHTVDDEEAEHYDKLAERENEARKQRKEEDSEAVASFEQERKRLRPEDTTDASFMQNVQRQQREKAAADRAKAAASASQRAKCQFKVRKANDAPA